MDLLSGIGWLGSALLVYSILQRSMLRLRLLNLAASLILVFYNALVHTWPMVGLNGALVLVNAWFLLRTRDHASAGPPNAATSHNPPACPAPEES